MGLFDDLLSNEGAAPPWGRIAATFMGGLQASGGGKIVEQLTQFGAHLARNAIRSWGPGALRPTFCAYDGCDGQALPTCAACGRRYCVAHSMLSFYAECICENCAKEISEQKRKACATAPVGTPTVKEALRDLRLRQDATWAEIRAQYRKLAAKHHPDHAKSDSAREKAETRMRKVNVAYEVLRAAHERKAAA